ncbi:MAG: hypothetical protein MUF85_03045 [Patescibacteria group bacterium]|nr:hypothetical protein [Patescibacteria group bacterium]
MEVMVRGANHIKEIDSDRLKYYREIKPGETIYLGCADDRCICDESLSTNNLYFKHFMRAFGGPFGLAHIVTLYSAAYSKDYYSLIAKQGKSFVGILVNRIDSIANKIFATTHSDTTKEDGQVFDSELSEDIGCAFANNNGLINEIMLDEKVLEVALRLSGNRDNNDDSRKLIVEAISKLRTGIMPGDFKYTRIDFAELKAPKLVLNGNHAQPENTAVIINYTNKISEPNPENPFYSADICLIAKSLIAAFPEIIFDAATLMMIIEMQAVATAKALATGSTLEMLPIEVFGDRQQAIIEIQQLIDEMSA